MNAFIRSLSILTMLFISCAFAAEDGERYALLVGVTEYREDSGLVNLQFPESDMRNLKDTLVGLGFDADNVRLMIQNEKGNDRFKPRRDNIVKELQLLLKNKKPEDVVLVMFAGHGLQFRGDDKVYFCPSDAKVDGKENLLDLNDVFETLKTCRAANKLLIADSCRDDPLFKGLRGGPASVTRPPLLKPPQSVAALFSCGEGESAFEDEKELHAGVFTHFLIKGLKGGAIHDGEVSASALADYVQRKVFDYVSAKRGASQMPVFKMDSVRPLVLAKISVGTKPIEPEKKPEAKAAGLDLKTDKDIASYALGLNYGMGAKQFIGDLDVELMAASFADAIAGRESKLSDEEMAKMYALFQAFMEKKQKGDNTAVLENKAGVSQALGRNMGRRLSFAAASLNAELVAKAFVSAANGEPTTFSPAEHKDTIEKYFKAIQGDMVAKNKDAGVKNQKEGDDFLAENEKKGGVFTTATGLQYKILKRGNGEIPNATDSVQVEYEGRFLDGKVFDSTKKHGKPFDTDLVHLIPGWIEALKMMPVGSKWQLYIPGNLAYGENGSPPDIPANKMLIFDMELLNIKGK